MSSPLDRDRGLQPERTLLAWQRTLFLLTVVTLLYLRIPPESTLAGTVGQLIVVCLLCGTAITLAIHLERRWRRTDHGWYDGDAQAPPAPLALPWALLLLSATVVGIGVVTLVSAFPG